MFADTVDQKPKPQFCLWSESYVFCFNCSRLTGGSTSSLVPVLHVLSSSAAAAGGKQACLRARSWRALSERNAIWLSHDLLWQRFRSAVLCRRKLSTDAYRLLCFWHVEQGQCGAAVPKEACFILCLLKCGSLHSLLAPSQSHPCPGHQVLFSKCCTLFFLLTQPSSPRPASESA